MLVSEFVEKYQSSKQKNAFVEKQIKTKYLNFETKISLAQNIVNLSMYKEINGKSVFVQNTPMRYELFVQAVVSNYTNLEWDKADDDSLDVLKGFNLLEQNGLVEVLFASIGDDIQKFSTVLNMVIDDEADRNRSIVPFLQTKFEAINMVLDTLSQAMETPEIKKKITEFVGANNGMEKI